MDVARSEPFTVHFVSVPDYWTNFVHHCCKDIPSVDRLAELTVVNRQLSQWGAVCIRRDYEWYLYWSDAAAHTAFVLRWT